MKDQAERITDGEHSVRTDAGRGRVQFTRGDTVLCEVPATPGHSYLWFKTANGDVVAFIQSDETGDREQLYP